jgi:ribosomal protein L7Ae-like RNA K-turn-binding protein
MKTKILNLLGFAQRAGKVMSGEGIAESSIKKRKAKLVILGEDASERTKKELIFLADKFNVPLIEIGSKAELGLAIGKSPRAVVLIVDAHFAKAIKDSHISK